MEPGHGKTVVVAYLAGSKGKISDALLLGLVVTLSHTAVIFLLALLVAAGLLGGVEGKGEGYLSLLAGFVVVGVALSSFFRRTPDHDHGHPHADPHPSDPALLHHHTRSDDDSRDHAHEPDRNHGQQPRPDPSERGLERLVGLGISGGMIPCPGALAVLLASVASGRALSGVSLVLAFSLGLAATLIFIGIAAVKLAATFRGALESRGSGLVRWASAGVMMLMGLLAVGRGIWLMGT